MNMKRITVFLFLWTIGIAALTSHEQDLLKASDVSKIMKQILDHHVEKKEMSSTVLHQALTTYIEQFDPTRVYLLDREVEPFIHMSPDRLKAVLDQYKENNFSAFRELNKVIQQSILRSRKLRENLEHDNSLFENKNEIANPQTHFEGYAKTVEDLQDRIKQQFVIYLQLQKRRYGESSSNSNKKRDQMIRVFEDHLRDFENQYLFEDEKGTPLPAGEQENLFVIHVLKALASSLDAHTSFYRPSEAYDMRVRLQKEFQGIGLILKETPEGVRVVHMLEGGPAAKSGLIQVNDILLEVDGKLTSDYPFDKVMDLLHDSKDDTVTLVLKHPEDKEGSQQTYTVKLKREVIILNEDRVDVGYEAFGNGIIGVISLHSFYQNDNGITSEKDVREAIQKLDKKGNLKGLVLDLRDNSGGFLSQAVKVAGLFISNGIIVISKYSNGEEKFYRDVDSKTIFDGPLVVLTSKATASAAEIVAQALQDYGVALVVGDEHTYGKGTIQTQTVTDNQSTSYFKVTVGKYYTVSGKTPQKEGVKADVIVPGHWSQEKIGEEYLESTVDNDTITPAFDDKLSDVAPDVKPWYLKYYMPKLQHKKLVWRKMLPALRRNSEYRIANNKDYQYYLKHGDEKPAASEEEEEEGEWLSLSKKEKNFGEDDLQLQEALNIVKDMIQLHSMENHK
jgi:carboxyl-terminal processing protease